MIFHRNYLLFVSSFAISHIRVVVADGEEVEVFGLEHLVLLCVDKYYAPQVRDKPCVDRLVASVGRHKNVWDFWEEALQGEFPKVESKGIFINVYDLVGHGTIVLDLAVSIAHRLVVRVLDAALNVAEEEGLFPSQEPLT